MSKTTLHVSDLVVARLAARSARAVPGVTALVGGLPQTLLGIAADWLPHDPVPDELRTDGVDASVHDGEAEVRVTIATGFGTPCAELAARVRAAVAEEVGSMTGLTATVRVIIADIALP